MENKENIEIETEQQKNIEPKKEIDIKVVGLEKYYSGRKVLDDVSFEVQKGKIHGLIGPNGAGKTTVMKSITSLIIPEGGKIFVQGKEVGKDIGTNNELGFALSDTTMLQHLTVKDLIISCNYYLKGLDKDYVIDAINKHAIKKYKLHKIHELSTGWKKIVQLFNITLSKPKILILDEPTNGLDASNREKVFLELIRMRDKEQKTILISTHILEDLKPIADTFTIIKAGRTVYHGDKKEDLKEAYEKFFPLTTTKDSKDKGEEYSVEFNF